MTVLRVKRRSSVLTTSSLACLSRMPTINLTAGCAIGCTYCYAVGYSSYPGEGSIALYDNTLELLKSELAHKRSRPRAVYFSPSTDIFQPVPEVLEIGYEILAFLLAEGVGVAFVTKGQIPEGTMRLLLKHPDKVQAQIGLITLNERLLDIFEPGAATPTKRLAQMQTLVGAGIPTVARVSPILPGLTDTPELLNRLMAEVAGTGVRRVAASALFLRRAILESLRRSVSNPALLDPVLAPYDGARRIPVRAEHSGVLALPLSARAEAYERVRDVAVKYGLTMSICACMNPDLARGTCHIGGTWTGGLQPNSQLALFSKGSSA